MNYRKLAYCNKLLLCLLPTCLLLVIQLHSILLSSPVGPHQKKSRGALHRFCREPSLRHYPHSPFLPFHRLPPPDLPLNPAIGVWGALSLFDVANGHIA